MSTTTWVSPTRNQSGYQQMQYSTYCPSQTNSPSWYRPSEPVEYQPKPKINYTQDSNHNITHLGNGGIRIYLQPNYLTGPSRLYEANSSGFSSMKSDRSQLKSLPSIDDHYYGVGYQPQGGGSYQPRGGGSYQSQGRENLIGRSDDRDLQPQSYKWFEQQQNSIHFNEDDHSSDSNNSENESDEEFPDGCRGLVNLGNTCFMNSILQCLSYTQPLLEYCQKKEYKTDINKSSSKGALMTAFADLMKSLWNGHQSSYSPREFRAKLANSAKCFDGFNQHDAQEFLMFLLQGLSEDVARGKQKRKLFTLLTKSDINIRDKAAQKAWKNFLDRENSKIVELFMGQLKSTLICNKCGNTSHTFDPVLGLSLPVEDQRGEVSLRECLELYCQKETLDGKERTVCESCDRRSESTKWLSIQIFPKILIIHLKRFSSESSKSPKKIQTHVSYPIKKLNLKRFSSDRDEVSYSLYGVVNHYGSPNSGHYVSFVQHQDNGVWYRFDDDLVVRVTEKAVVSSNAYILFYKLLPS